MTTAFEAHKIRSFRTLHDWVIVRDMNFSERITSSGIFLPNDNGKGTGIRPRWGQVYAVGPEQKSVSPGQWICVAHGRWTRGVRIDDGQSETTLRRIDADDILLVSDGQPDDDTISDAIHVDKKTR